MLSQVFGSRASSELQFEGEGDADVVLGSLASIADSNPGISVFMLDHQGLEVSEGEPGICWRQMSSWVPCSHATYGPCQEEAPMLTRALHALGSMSEVPLPLLLAPGLHWQLH